MVVVVVFVVVVTVGEGVAFRLLRLVYLEKSNFFSVSGSRITPLNTKSEGSGCFLGLFEPSITLSTIVAKEKVAVPEATGAGCFLAGVGAGVSQ